MVFLTLCYWSLISMNPSFPYTLPFEFFFDFFFFFGKTFLLSFSLSLSLSLPLFQCLACFFLKGFFFFLIFLSIINSHWRFISSSVMLVFLFGDTIYFFLCRVHFLIFRKYLKFFKIEMLCFISFRCAAKWFSHIYIYI